MSERNQEQIQGHWESQSYAAKTTKIGDNPSVTEGRKASAEGTFDERGKPIATESYKTTFTDKGHPGTIEYKNADQPKSIK